jgi:hypothetical protein
MMAGVNMVHVSGTTGSGGFDSHGFDASSPSRIRMMRRVASYFAWSPDEAANGAGSNFGFRHYGYKFWPRRGCRD